MEHNKSQQTSEDDVTPPAAPSAPLQARSPYRPLSRRRRQEQVVEPPPAVERPSVSMAFDASPTSIAAALAKAGASADQPVLVWKADGQAGSGAAAEADRDIEVVEDPGADG